MAVSPRTFVHNWRLKLVALALAVFLWALVQTEPRNADTFSSVPVIVEVSDSGWTTSGAPTPAAVELRVSGPAREIYRLAREGTAVRIPVRQVGAADTTITLHRDWVALNDGGGLTVESINPSSVRVSFEKAVTRALPVAVDTEGALPPNVALASPIGLNPPVIRVRGASSRVDGLDSVRLQPLDLSKVESSGVFELPVDTAGHAGLRFMPTNATVGIRVEEKIERVLSVPIIAQLSDPRAAVVVSPTQVEVTLRGARTLVTAVDPADLRAWVAPELLRDMQPGEQRRVPVRVEGVPRLVEADLVDELVTVRRAADVQDELNLGDAW